MATTLTQDKQKKIKQHQSAVKQKGKKQGAVLPQQGPVDQNLQQTMEYFSGPQAQAGADIAANVQQDILGPGYQAATYGTAAGGLPGAVGRVRAGQDAANRKAAIESARMRRENTLASAQIGLEAVKQQTARQQISFEQGQSLSQMYGDALAFLESSNMIDDYGPALPGALDAATEIMRTTGDPLAAQQAFYSALGIGTAATATTGAYGPGSGAVQGMGAEQPSGISYGTVGGNYFRFGGPGGTQQISAQEYMAAMGQG